jgi:hypothetical protein
MTELQTKIRGRTQILDKSIVFNKLADNALSIVDAKIGGEVFKGQYLYIDGVLAKVLVDIPALAVADYIDDTKLLYIEQRDQFAPFAAKQPVLKGYRVYESGATWVVTASHVTGDAWDATEQAGWEQKSSPAKPYVFIADNAPAVPDYDAEWVQPVSAGINLANSQVKITLTSLANPAGDVSALILPHDTSGAILYSTAPPWAAITVNAGTLVPDSSNTYATWTIPAVDFPAGATKSLIFPAGEDVALLEDAGYFITSDYSVSIVLVNTLTGIETPFIFSDAGQGAHNFVRPSSGVSDFDLYANIPGAGGVRSWIKQIRSDVTRTELNAILGVALADGTLGTFVQDIIPDGSTVKSALQALESKVAGLDVLGEAYLPAATTFAALTTSMTLADGSTVTAGKNDITFLSQDEVGTGTVENPRYPAGMYIHDGTAYGLGVKFNQPTLTADRFKHDQDATGAVDGTNKDFAVPEAYVAGTLEVFVNNYRQTVGSHYTIGSGLTFSLLEAPSVADGMTDRVSVDYVKAI